METLLLDPAIGWGATLPIFIIVILAAVSRRYVTTILGGSGAPPTTNLEEMRKSQVLARASLLQTNCHILPLAQFVQHRDYFTRKNGGALRVTQPQMGFMQKLMMSQSDPSAMFTMMKNQIVYIFLSGGVGYLISYLFPAFLIAKTPFLLPHKFGSVLQRRIDVPDLDPSYNSSLSWYFFTLLTCGPILDLVHYLIDGDDVAGADSHLGSMMTGLAPPMTGMMPMGGGGTDAESAMEREREALDSVIHRRQWRQAFEGAIEAATCPRACNE